MQISTNDFYIETSTRFTLPDEKELPAIDTVAYVYITYKDVMAINQSRISLNLRTGPTGHATLFNQ